MRISDWSSDVCSSDLQRGDDLFREPRRAVLPDMPVARDAGGRLSGPGLECKASASEVVTIVIEIGDHFEEVADDDGSPGRIGTKVPGIGIDQCLIDRKSTRLNSSH